MKSVLQMPYRSFMNMKLFHKFILIYVLTLPLGNNWQLFLIAVPAEILVFLACNIRRRPRHKKAPKAAK